jgi:TonB-linked SusC/RagA family outer membrane protein
MQAAFARKPAILLSFNLSKVMKVFKHQDGVTGIYCLKKPLIFMKLTLALILLFNFQLLANSFGQNRITLSLKSAGFKQILVELEKNSSYRFTFSERKIPTKQYTNINVVGIDIFVFLERLLDQSEFTFQKLPNNLIAITAKDLVGVDIQVTGKVLDELGKPLPGANVKVKGQTGGVSTDPNGNFSISAPDNATLIISYLNYTSQEIAINGRNNIEIKLLPAEQKLDEVVVIGFGTQKKSDLTGAVQRVDLEASRDAPNTNIIQSIQGAVPGINIGQVNSAGQTPNIQVRGANTLSGSSAVLIVLDGIIYTGSLASINPDDVASIDILKDASSTAIYGAQAANGVMLITTKKGKIGKTRISYTGSYATQSPNVDLRPLNRDEFLEKIRDLNYDKAYLAPAYTNPDPFFNLSQYVDFTMRDANNNIKGNDFNWWKEGTKTGSIQEHQLSVSGGSENTTFLLSAGLTDQTGFIINDKYNRKSFRINLETKIRDWWKLGVQAFTTLNDYSGDEPDLDALIRQSPLLVPYDENGKLIASPTQTNVPNPFLTYDVDNYSKRNDFFGLFYTEINFPFIKGLSYRLNYGNNYRINNDYYASRYDAGLTGSLSKSETNYYDYTIDNILSYNRTFGKHDLSATLVYGAIERMARNTVAGATDVPSFNLGYDALELGINQTVNSGAWSETLNSQTARVNYKYNNKYLLTATLRRDGFSGFAKNEKTAIFPSTALGWIVSNEDFFKVPWVDVLKLRASYGVNGNLGSRYASLATFSRSRRYVFGDGGESQFGQSAQTLANPNLRWEKSSGVNLGLDFALFKNRLSGNIEYYNNTTIDLIYNIPLPGIVGIATIPTNVGNIKNQGFEFQLTSQNIKNGNFSWSSTLNFSTNKNKIAKLLGIDANGDGQEDDLVASNLFIGRSIGSVYNYQTNGIYQIGETIPAGYYPGTQRIIDLNGDGRITPDDRSILGRSEPAYRFSILNKFSYKRFSLTALFNSVQGGKNGYLANVLPTSVGGLRNDNSIRYNYFSAINYWSPRNPDGTFPRSLLAPAQATTIYRDRSFVRLQDVSLSYDVKSTVLTRLGVSALRVYMSGKNLATWTKWEGWDPETGQGFDENGRPVLKGYSFGLNITL